MNVLLSLFGTFIKIGAFGFGGGMAMLPLIFQGMNDLGLMTSSDFADLVAISQVTPGPIAVNAATFAGYGAMGLQGALIATLGVSIPAFILVNIVYEFIKKFRESHLVKGVFAGVTPATVAFILAAAVIMGKATLYLSGEVQLIPVVMCITSLVMLGKFKINPLLVLMIMGVLGVILCG
ncbi:MAG TPA: chromate transporter [Anaerovoracaceae bacterium]|nr:chromate transporter [Anaerovoracaceae bacterium]